MLDGVTINSQNSQDYMQCYATTGSISLQMSPSDGKTGIIVLHHCPLKSDTKIIIRWLRLTCKYST